ncbi:TPA: hypothetical protein PNO69_004497 [Salmonella enterica]|nr:hypothetical protein [Salmonella enterica]HCH9607940.1 hypothetical protein [Salmonella enterica]HDI5000234.1 hypothetical protein [Salmonella enterica]HDI5005055.1 hypothetical protein [Salmonella enterica]
MITAKEVYQLPSQSETNELWSLKGYYYDFLPEIGDELYSIKPEDNKRLKIKVLKEFDFDGRRFWRLQTLWIDNKPVMIMQNAGREGDDHRKRFITNKELYKEVVSYVRELIGENLEDSFNDFIDENTPYNYLEFYGNHLNGHFERY